MEPPVTQQHILNCAFSAWYPSFAHVSLNSRVLKPLPSEFIDYLSADGIVLPLDPNGNLQPSYTAETHDDDDSSINWNNSDNDDDDDQPQPPSFPELESQIAQAIEELGGAVFPKLNWSSPKDATWITLTSTLKCKTSGDIFLLLKSSDFIVHDLEHAFETVTVKETDSDCTPLEFELVLRKWYDLSPSMEFRCFVRNHTLIGISQRDSSNYYPFLQSMRSDLEASIQHFFNSRVQYEFPNNDYTFDIYINKSTLHPFIIDFNPFSSQTDTLLFSWPELLSQDSTPFQPLLRLVESQMQASQAAVPAFSTNRVPKDVIDLSNGQDIADFARQWKEEVEMAAVELDA